MATVCCFFSRNTKRLAMAVVLTVQLFSMAQSYALSQAQHDVISSGIRYFNVEQDSPYTNCGATDASLQGNENLQKIFNFFVQNGFSKEQAAGIVGNIANESTGDPERWQQDEKDHQDPPEPDNTGIGWGIVQFTPARKMLTYASSMNVKAYDLSAQLQFLLAQLNGTYPASDEKGAGDQIKSTTTVADATAAFMGTKNISSGQYAGLYIGYERPADEAKDLAARVASAENAFRSYGPGVVATTAAANASATADSSSCGASAVAGNAVQTALNYSWPTYHPSPYFSVVSSYGAAIAKAQANGEYVGGSGGGQAGIDCGGFITRVMRDSGADPNYNWGPHDPRQGPTTSQQAYMDAHPEKYQNLGVQTSTQNLQPGDIAINSNHTYIYLGSQPGRPGYNDADSSLGQRAPMANNAFWDDGGPFTFYRLKQ